MIVRIAKEFRWEMGHRLPFHNGLCRNLHGHSYRLHVVVDGSLDANGMVIDYFDLKRIVQPVVDELDHACIVDAGDAPLLDFYRANPLKHVVVPFTTTAEHLAQWLHQRIDERLKEELGGARLTIRLQETETTYAEVTG